MKSIAAVAITLAVVVAGAAPAFAHEEIRPDTVQTGKPTFFTLFAANEKETDLTKVVLTAPPGTKLGESTRSPAGWTAAATDSSVTWTGGKVAPGNFDEWGFEIDGADQPGTLNFKVTMTAGDSEDITVPVTVVAAGSTQTPSTTAATSGATVTSAVASPTTTAAASPAPAPSDSRSGWALGVAIAALVVGLAAVALAAAARRTRGPATSTTQPQAQDF